MFYNTSIMSASTYLILLFLICFPIVASRNKCWRVHRSKKLINLDQIRSYRSRNLRQCGLLCLGQLNCNRIIFNSDSHSCKLYNLPSDPGPEYLVSSHRDMYAVMNKKCVAKSQGNDKVLRSAKDYWSQWSDWSRCYFICGTGIKKRHRNCRAPKVSSCPGPSEETTVCQKSPCSQWNEWREWTQCSTTCGSGTRTRDRTCNTQVGCPGNSLEQEQCPYIACNQWFMWGPWSACSKMCGGGKRERNRRCTTPGSCDGEAKATKDCNTQSCCAKWSQWSECSATCGNSRKAGVEAKRRRCSIQTFGRRTRSNRFNGFSIGGYAAKEETVNRQCRDLSGCPEWSAWQHWSQCTSTCGGGRRHRIRRCSTPGYCDGPATGEKTCNDAQCPGWGDWTQWTYCDVTCGGGIQTRNRQCSVRGRCDGDNVERKDCNICPCPQWTDWTPWSLCSVSCGGGWQTHDRVCSKPNEWSKPIECSGKSKEKQRCNEYECPAMQPWNAWGTCTEQCGGGLQRRVRSCSSDPDFCQADLAETPSCQCKGDTENSRVCNSHKCASWSNWEPWGECSSECDGGSRVRQRTCENDASFCIGFNKNHPLCICDGGDIEDSPCNEHSCPQWSSWGKWEQCSVPCGGGDQYRQRMCTTDPDYCSGSALFNDSSCQCDGDEEDDRLCNEFECPYWDEWTEWSECSVTCSKGQKERKRICITDDEHCNGNKQLEGCDCDGDDVDVIACDAGQCYQWSQWGAWSKCSQVCGGGSRNRARQCPVAGACPGLDEETEFCNQIPCPDWGSWSPWSSCSVSCGGGQRVRNRACPIDDACRPGEPFEANECGMDTCPEWTKWSAWSLCDRSCGEGNRKRERICQPIDGCLGRGKDVEPCFDQACPLTTHWSAWSPCTETCGGGTQTRSRASCPNPGCPTEKENQQCSDITCPSWGRWEAWSQCSTTCGAGSRTRNRLCVDTSNTEIPRGCVGKGAEIDGNPCNDIPCQVFWLF